MSICDYTFRVFKYQWGIYVKLIGEYTSKNNYVDSCIQICPGLWLTYLNEKAYKYDRECRPTEDDKKFFY